MKMYVLVGAAALFAIALMMVPAVAATSQLIAMGTVTDERSNPVQGANVTLIDDTVIHNDFHVLGSTTSDASGNFKFVNVELTGSPYIKVIVSFAYNGTTYTISPSDMRWYDASAGLVSFNLSDTRLYHYPVSDHGYVWGPVLDGATNGRPLNATVYLVNDTTMLMAETSPNGSYQIEAEPGDYEIYALRVTGGQWFISKRTKITVAPSYSLDESYPLMLVADIMTTAPSSTPVPAGKTLNAYGTVTDLQGNPVAGANVTLIDDNFRTLGTTATDANGNFHFIVANWGGSGIVKAKVSYVHAGQTYNTSMENVLWSDASSGLLNFNPMDMRLYNYPPGDHGYVWGVVLDSHESGKSMDSVVYLKNNTVLLSTNTSVSGNGGFHFEVAPGDYEIYAVHDSADGRFVSKRTMIHVYQSNDILLSAPITLFVGQKSSGRPVEVLPLAAALVLGILMVFAMWVILSRKR